MSANVGGGEMGRPASLAVQALVSSTARWSLLHAVTLRSAHRGVGHSVPADQCADWDVADIRRAHLAVLGLRDRGRRRRRRQGIGT